MFISHEEIDKGPVQLFIVRARVDVSKLGGKEYGINAAGLLKVEHKPPWPDYAAPMYLRSNKGNFWGDVGSAKAQITRAKKALKWYGCNPDAVTFTIIPLELRRAQ